MPGARHTRELVRGLSRASQLEMPDDLGGGHLCAVRLLLCKRSAHDLSPSQLESGINYQLTRKHGGCRGICRRVLSDWRHIAALSRRFKTLVRQHAAHVLQTAMSDWIGWKKGVLATKIQRAWYLRKLLRLRLASVIVGWSWHVRR